MSIAVVTGSVGRIPELHRAVRSVRNQTLRVKHYVFVDGEEHEAAVREVLGDDGRGVCVVVLPENTGGTGYNAHRIYAAAAWLVEEADWIAYLDEDCWLQPTHFEDLWASVGERHEWAHSLRTIVDSEGRPVCDDMCESLGGLRHSVLSPGDFLVDVNCYLLKVSLARRVSFVWDAKARDPTKMEVDRAMCHCLLGAGLLPAVSRKHTVVYTAGSSPTSVRPEFFLEGNRRSQFDTTKRDVYVLHYTPEATRRLCSGDAWNPLEEWAPTTWDGLRDACNLIDGYANAPIVPPGSILLCTLWHPSAFPEALLARDDLFKVVYTVESPNVRHKDQWAWTYLDRFDVVLTYWKPLLRAHPNKAVFCPMNVHPADLDDPLHRPMVLRENQGEGRSVGMVLERRPQLFGTYEVDGVRLTCLDPLREAYAVGLRELVVFGKGWDGVEGVRVGRSCGKPEDTEHSVDILQRFVFALVLENCDAEGYVSEKIYDAWMAGCVPLYYGTVPGCEDMLLDIRPYADGAALQRRLDALSEEEVAKLRRAVAEGRERALRTVDVHAVAGPLLEHIL